ncbi:MAG: ComEC/Rec2 family competence protein [Candidatus Pacebacteria bacterium]|nr:ComEC/Rec2 family competence protein [Candidatus Paceibacterota bacterium]
MEYLKAHRRSALLLFLLIINISIWYAVSAESRHGVLTVAVLNIGQGDAIFIEAPNGNQIIVDGGPDQRLLSELGHVMPFYDRSIDMIINTNPDSDHYAGFLDLLKSYKVGEFMESGTVSDTPTYHELEKTVAEKHIPKIIAKRGMKILLDKDVSLYVLYPDRDVSNWTSNNGSIVMKLVYGDTSFLLQGDATAEVEKYLISLEKSPESRGYGGLSGQVLKVGHHGSRTSTSEEYVEAVSPEYAAISDGKNNRYGHPHKETLETLQKNNVKILRTDLQGRIIFESDGETIAVK